MNGVLKFIDSKLKLTSMIRLNVGYVTISRTGFENMWKIILNICIVRVCIKCWTLQNAKKYICCQILIQFVGSCRGIWVTTVAWRLFRQYNETELIVCLFMPKTKLIFFNLSKIDLAWYTMKRMEVLYLGTDLFFFLGG